MALAAELSKYFSNYRIFDSQELDHVSAAGFEHISGAIDLIGCGTSHEQSISWINWLQKLIEQGRTSKYYLTILGVTKGLESFENKAVHLSGASRAGLYRMLQSEYSHLTSRHADMDSAASHEELAKLIADEFYANSTESEVCYRDGKRYRAYLAEQPADAAGLYQKQVSFSAEKDTCF